MTPPQQTFGANSPGLKPLVANEGIAPGKVKLFQVFCKGQAQRSP